MVNLAGFCVRYVSRVPCYPRRGVRWKTQLRLLPHMQGSAGGSSSARRHPCRALIFDQHGNLELATILCGNHTGGKLWRCVRLPLIDRYRGLAIPKGWRLYGCR